MGKRYLKMVNEFPSPKEINRRWDEVMDARSAQYYAQAEEDEKFLQDEIEKAEAEIARFYSSDQNNASRGLRY
jgi:hypothetical protein